MMYILPIYKEDTVLDDVGVRVLILLPSLAYIKGLDVWFFTADTTPDTRYLVSRHFTSVWDLSDVLWDTFDLVLALDCSTTANTDNNCLNWVCICVQTDGMIAG